MVSRTWYVSCSPRSPEKIKPELEQLATLEGESWAARDSAGNLVTQIRFARFATRNADILKEAYMKKILLFLHEIGLPMQTYGFAYT